jgi:uncharacterized protein (DUF111 family)
MSILYLDCQSGISERTFFAGLLDLGLSPQILDSLPEMLKLPAEKLIDAVHENRLGEYLLHEGDGNPPTIGLFQFQAQAKTSLLPVKIGEEIQQILSRAKSDSEFSTESILLLIGILIGLEELHIDNLFCSPLPVSIPASETGFLKILQTANIPITNPGDFARSTLPGILLLAQKATFNQPDLRITHISHVTQHIKNEDQLAMRLILGESASPTKKHKMSLIQTNLDDITPQHLAYVIEKLIGMGALEAYQIPLGMKKNRLGYQLNTVVRSQDESQMVATILQETPTLGVRIYYIDDHVMATSEMQQISTRYGIIPIKLKLLGDKVVGLQPEYEICAKIAAQFNLSLPYVYAIVQNEAYKTNLKRFEVNK